jgi:hypothetical protein
MSSKLKRSIAMVLAVLVVGSTLTGAFAGSAVALTSASVTATDDGTGATTDHTVSASSDSDSGDIKEITIDYTETNVEDVTANDVNVTIAGTDQTVDSVNVTDSTTVTVTIGTAYTLDSTVAESVDVDLGNVTNPQNAADYNVTMEIADGTGSTIDTATATFTVTVGDVPSVDSTNSTVHDGATVTDYNGSDENTETVQVEAHTDNLEFELIDSNETVATFGSAHDSFTVVESATDTAAGTYEWTINQSELRSIDMGVNENTTLNAKVHNNDVSDAVNDFSFTVENGEEVSQVNIASQNDSGVELFEESGFLADRFDRFADSHATIETTRDVTSNTSSIFVSVSDSELADEFAASVSDDTEAGDRLGLLMASSVDDELVYVFYQEPGETIDGEAVDPAEDKYIVYDDSGDVDMLEVNLPSGEYADGDTVSMTLVGNDRPGASDLRNDLSYGFLQSFGLSWGLSFPLSMTGGFGSLAASFVVISRRRAAA